MHADLSIIDAFSRDHSIIVVPKPQLGHLDKFQVRVFLANFHEDFLRPLSSGLVKF